MGKDTTLDFTGFSQSALEQALRNINRDKYPENYAACVAEIERRKAAGEWAAEERKAAKATLARDYRLARIAAVLASIVIVALIVFGIYNLSSVYTPEIRTLTAQIQSEVGAQRVIFSHAKDGSEEIPWVSVFFAPESMTDANNETRFAKLAPLIMNSNWGKGKHAVKVSLNPMPSLSFLLNADKFRGPVEKILHY